MHELVVGRVLAECCTNRFIVGVTRNSGDQKHDFLDAFESPALHMRPFTYYLSVCMSSKRHRQWSVTLHLTHTADSRHERDKASTCSFVDLQTL